MSLALSTQNTTIESKSDLLYKNLLRFYKNNPEYKNTMLTIITGKSTISLRIIDWFVTNYAKQFGTEYTLKAGLGMGSLFKVNVSYKLQLKSYGKSEFDPFCRSERVRIPYNEVSEVETTIGQLNFFKWVLENEILEFISVNYDKINNDMQKRGSGSLKRQNDATAAANGEEGPKTRKKRRELSVSAIKRITRKDVEIVLRFNEHDHTTIVSAPQPQS